MMSFPETALEEVATIIMGTSPKGTTYNEDGIGMPLLNGPTEFGPIHPACTLFTTASKRECEAGDLIFCVRGSTTGRMNWADQPYSLGRGVCAIRGETESDTRFIKYCLDWKLDAMLKLAGGGTFPNLTKGDIHTFPIPFPKHRQKITAVLSAYDDLIENNTRRIAILEEMAQAIYREWFVHFRFPGHEDAEMVESELGPIPAGWEVVRLKDVCSLTLGQSPKSEFYNEEGEGLPFHQGVADFGDRFPDDRRYCTKLKRTANPGDILFSVRAPVGRMNIARSKIVIGRGLHAIRSKTGRQAFIYQQLQEKFHEEDMMGGGTIFKSVTKKDMLNIKLLFPVPSVLDRFEGMMKPIHRILEIYADKNDNLRQTRDLLLPRLISGELDVSNKDVVPLQ